MPDYEDRLNMTLQELRQRLHLQRPGGVGMKSVIFYDVITFTVPG